ncbi:MAG TPA: pseudouridine-5'-phosphate glycosidase [Candidatus Limnocylindria bacterium]
MKLRFGPGVREAIAARRPVVALESTVIAHGLPHPMNLATARLLEADIREAGAMPATIAIADGMVVVGADDTLLQRLATESGVWKVSTRDLAPLLARGRSGGLGATTVATTVEIAAAAGIAIFVTGGIGGVHRGAERTLDISADLGAIARHPVCVVCAGAKLILDLPRTMEVLETLGVPVIGFATNELPAFYARSSGLPLAHRVDDAIAAARVVHAQLQRGAGLLVTVPIPTDAALDGQRMEREVASALEAAVRAGVTGSALTPFLLARMNDTTTGRTFAANVALLRNNARTAAAIAHRLSDIA